MLASSLLSQEEGLNATKRIEVLLANDVPEERWLSMHRYGRELYRRLVADSDLEVRLGQPLSSTYSAGSAEKLLHKYVGYPWQMWRVRGPLVHVLDHSYAHLVLYARRSRVIVTCHDLYSLHDWCGSWLTRLAWRIHGLAGLRQADWIVADSTKTKEDVTGLLGYPPDRVEVIFPGVSPQFCRDPVGAEALSSRLGLDPNGPKRVMHVGSVQPRKNVETVLRVIAELRLGRGVDVELLRVGEAFSPTQERLVDALGIRPVVRVLQGIADDDLVSLYSLSDVLLFPSIFEGFGLPIIEAMACGLPVVCSKCPPMDEVAGPAALLCEPRSVDQLAGAVQRVLTDSALARDLMHKGFQRAAFFSWDATAKRLAELYRRVLDIDAPTAARSGD